MTGQALGHLHKRGQRAEPRRILLMMMGDIADILRMTPSAKALRRRYPAAHIVVLVTDASLPAIQGCSYVDEVLLWRSSGKGVPSLRYLWRKLIECIALTLRLRGRFDLVVGPTGGNPLPNVLAFATGAPRRVGYDLFHTGFLLSDNLGRKEWGLQEEDMTARLLEVVDVVEEADDPYIEIWPTADDERLAASLLQEKGIAEDDVVVAICPGSDWSCQQWHLSHWAVVGDALAHRHGARIVVVGIDREKRLAERLGSLMKHKPIDLTGRTTVGQLAGVLRRCRLTLTLESAPCAVAIAVGTPTVALFGAIPVWVRGRHRAPVAVITEAEGTPPSCYTLCKKTKMERGVHRCESDECVAGDGLMSITPDNVLRKAEALLSGVPIKKKEGQSRRVGSSLSSLDRTEPKGNDTDTKIMYAGLGVACPTRPARSHQP